MVSSFVVVIVNNYEDRKKNILEKLCLQKIWSVIIDGLIQISMKVSYRILILVFFACEKRSGARERHSGPIKALLNNFVENLDSIKLI